MRAIEVQKTLTLEQVFLLLEKSKDTPIHMQVLFNVLMGLRRGEINGVKYSDVDYVNRTLKVSRQLGVAHNTKKEDFAPKTFTKQEIGLKTESSYREIPIPDYVFEAILKERELYEKHKSRRKNEFQDLGYICCSTYGRPRSKSFHWKYYKKLLEENDLPDIRWHDLRSTFCTLLLKNDFNPKAVAKLMGHSKEIITMDVYGDNRGIIADGVPEMEEYMEEVLPDEEEQENFKDELLDIVVGDAEFLADESD
jgi:integrase